MCYNDSYGTPMQISVTDSYLQFQDLSGLSTLAFPGLFKTVVVDLNRMSLLTQNWRGDCQRLKG